MCVCVCVCRYLSVRAVNAVQPPPRCADLVNATKREVLRNSLAALGLLPASAAGPGGDGGPQVVEAPRRRGSERVLPPAPPAPTPAPAPTEAPATPQPRPLVTAAGAAAAVAAIGDKFGLRLGGGGGGGGGGGAGGSGAAGGGGAGGAAAGAAAPSGGGGGGGATATRPPTFTSPGAPRPEASTRHVFLEETSAAGRALMGTMMGKMARVKDKVAEMREKQAQ